MKILIMVKRVTDPNVTIRPNMDSSNVDLTNVKMAMNPFCEIATEEAIRLKEAGIASEVIVLSIGDKQSQDQIRTSLAMGADRGILIETDATLEPLNIAKLAAKVIEEEEIDLVLLGKQSSDKDNNQTGQMLAAIKDWGQATFASKLYISNEKATVTREVDTGLQTIELTLPAIVTCDLRLNTPRFASLPNIMKAKRKPLVIKPIEEFGLDLTPRFKMLNVESPQVREAGDILGSVDELLEKLKTTEGVL
ncbi:electron transfer flavoprotein subunit beta/FixA family protein [Psychromonas sp. 14N.309.X.WAT.B.A12]|uniref:electron transfer flavoprotein subunit beta/FixA family protein n=1 Tax=Psychromonas sp. 14N.309.X.WAT.B.A12 TaxID=2998322 RepID=UPI0025B24360|nr:electron transfer flavoprotein subunit beta/FixA family protein [Psychromonas sp. 14N.309.X.WAT.B.A12]MDN2664581.1 electron transfer flavoprotein subunit beta/FixA family protein [Psychromonas sp. 14N.309.X.WAT.B.A12]